MNIIDSSLWLEYFSGTLTNDDVLGIIEDSASQYVPSVCLYEVYKRMLTDRDESAALSSVSFMQNAVVVSITPQIAILAARLGKAFRLPMADSIIYATAQTHNAKIYTQDKHFEGLGNVQYLPKP